MPGQPLALPSEPFFRAPNPSGQPMLETAELGWLAIEFPNGEFANPVYDHTAELLKKSLHISLDLLLDNRVTQVSVDAVGKTQQHVDMLVHISEPLHSGDVTIYQHPQKAS
jgi:hypothetical protein